jgi:hypothetical protein
MKVLKKPEVWSAIVSCRECKAKLEVDETDLTIRYVGSDDDATICVICPECCDYVPIRDLQFGKRRYWKMAQEHLDREIAEDKKNGIHDE